MHVADRQLYSYALYLRTNRKHNYCLLRLSKLLKLDNEFSLAISVGGFGFQRKTEAEKYQKCPGNFTVNPFWVNECKSSFLSFVE